ncbi:MAG: flagellar biosynthesis anti-sigma factor FlgM [Desulfotomaculum sp.]|nr:flagellar biosynthesis anti-sigma factor FlgM [Desulfotomaculum sp.]
MKITPFNGINPIEAYKSQGKKNKTAHKNNKPRGDSVELSKTARETARYRAELKNMPQIRQEKVQDIKQRIESGTYKPSAEKIAEGMIRERRLDELV